MFERRQEDRRDQATLSLELKQGVTTETGIVVPVLCVSEKGLSFYVPVDKFKLRDGDILYNIRLFNKKHDKFIEQSKIVYCIKVEMEESEPLYKIGINFLVDSKKFNIRDKRFNFRDFSHFLKFKIDNNLALKGTLNNISKYGISIFLKDIQKHKQFFITKGVHIKNIFLEFQEVFFDIGTGTVVDIEFLNKDLILRVELLNKFLPLDNLLELQNEKRMDLVIGKLNESLNIKDYISDGFRRKVFNCRYVLDNIKESLDSFEEEIKYDDSRVKQINIINILYETTLAVKDHLDESMKEINKIIMNLQTDEYGIYSKYYKQNLHPLLLTTPINRQLFTKPVGYAGDLELIKYIMAGTYIGSTLFDKFMHKYTVETPVISAYKKSIIDNYNILKGNILKKLQSRNIVRISAVYSGICYDIFELLKKEDIADNCDISLFFTSIATMKYCKKEMLKLKRKYNRYTNTKFYFKSIYSTIYEPLIKQPIDIIHLSNVLEYMPDSYAIKLIYNLYTCLDKEGTLLLNQYSLDRGFQAYFEMGFDWFIHYRNLDDFKLLLKDIPELNDFQDEHEVLNLYLHLKIEKS